MPTTKKTTKTKKVINDSFFDKAGNVLKTIWSYISTGRDYFWKGVRFTLATGIFLFVAISIVSSTALSIAIYQRHITNHIPTSYIKWHGKTYTKSYTSIICQPMRPTIYPK